MDQERWQKIDELLEAALDRDPQERSGFLDAACDDPAVRQRVEALLAADARSQGILDRAPRIEAATTLSATGDPAAGVPGPGMPAGDRIGPYRIEREIARDGMGVVFLASRADHAFERRWRSRSWAPA